MTLEERARGVLADIVPLSINSTWDETETRNIVRAMLAFAAEERERAAKVAEQHAVVASICKRPTKEVMRITATTIASAIRTEGASQ